MIEYEMRNLNATDIAPMCKIINKIGINEFSKCFTADGVIGLIKNKGKKNVDEIAGIQVMLEAVNIIIGHIPDCENDIFAFLANITGAPIEEIKKLGIAEYVELIISVARKKEFQDFIGVVSKLFK